MDKEKEYRIKNLTLAFGVVSVVLTIQTANTSYSTWEEAAYYTAIVVLALSVVLNFLLCFEVNPDSALIRKIELMVYSISAVVLFVIGGRFTITAAANMSPPFPEGRKIFSYMRIFASVFLLANALTFLWLVSVVYQQITKNVRTIRTI